MPLDTSGHPYRSPQITSTRNRLPRLRARLRGLWRRTISPTLIVGGLGVASFFFVTVCYDTVKELVQNQEAANRLHFQDWQNTIDENQRQLNIKRSDLERREHDFNTRLQNFEDMLTIVGALSKDGLNFSVKEAVRHAKEAVRHAKDSGSITEPK